MSQIIKMSSFPFLCLLAMALFFPFVTSADTIYTPSKSNGFQVYLSPAKHSPENVGCSSYQESVNANKIAIESAKDLQEMGYTVRVGSGDYVANTSSSNSWQPDLHVPIHSNATTFDCSGSISTRGGTWTMYYSGSQSANTAANAILNAMKAYSPGINDKKLTDVEASGGSLYELRRTVAVAAYIEAAFHTFGPDVSWLLQNGSVGQRITNGIHSYAGVNDCRTQPCTMQGTSGIFGVSEAKADKQEIKIDTSTHGKKHPEIEKDIKNLIKGTKKDTVFLDSTANMLNAVSIDDQGTLVVDFKNFTHKLKSPSTFLTGKLNQELYETIFKYPEVNKVYYQFDGSFSDWCYWLQIVEEPVQRK